MMKLHLISRNILILFIICFSLNSCLFVDCNTEVVKRICNTPKTFQAIKTQTDCGATTTPARSLRIIEGCNLNDTPVKENFVYGSDQPFDFYWEGKNTLIISTIDTSQAYQALTKLELKNSNKVIRIKYELESFNTKLNPAIFKEFAIPKTDSEQWRELNHSSDEFQVINRKGKLVIRKHQANSYSKLKLNYGILEGINRGEFGGKLTFRSNEAPEKPIIILRDNIKFIFRFKNEIYVLTGLAHMFQSSGALYRLDYKEKSFSYHKLLDFDDAPGAFTIYKDQFLIATHEGFCVVKNFKKEIILKDIFWSSLYPNSIAAFDEKNIYIGMRGGIAILDLSQNKIKLYKKVKPNKMEKTDSIRLK